MVEICDTITVEKENTGQNSSVLSVESVDASVASTWDTVDVSVTVANVVQEGDGESLQGTVSIDLSTSSGGQDSEAINLAPNESTTVFTSFSSLSEGMYTVTATTEYNSAQDTVEVTEPVGDSSIAVVNNLFAASSADNQVNVQFSIGNQTSSGSGEQINAQYDVKVNGDTVDSGTATIGVGEEEQVEIEVDNVAAGTATIQVSTNSDSASDSVTVSGDEGTGGGGGGDGPDEGIIGGISRNQALIGAGAVAAVLVASNRGNNNRRRNNNRGR